MRHFPNTLALPRRACSHVIGLIAGKCVMKWSILYFDDDPVQLDIFREMFCHAYEVRTAATLSEARRLISETTFDIVISDLSMPEISGVDFLREAAQRNPSSVRVLVTGYATAGKMLPEISKGVVQFFLTKPWREQEMADVLDRAVAFLDIESDELYTPGQAG